MSTSCLRLSISSSACAVMLCAFALSSATFSSVSPVMASAAARACASLVAVPVASTVDDAATSCSSAVRACSACASSSMRCRSRRPFASCSRRSASWRAVASCDLVVISMASCTDFCSASRVRWSTGSTDWMSMLVITRRFATNTRRSRTFARSSRPNTALRITRAECLWKSSNDVAATAARTIDATALHASPTKSPTANSCCAAASSSPASPPARDLASTSKCQLYDSLSERRAWSLVSTSTTSLMKSGPSSSATLRIWPSFFGVPPLSDSTVNSSFGFKQMSSGPNTTRERCFL
mmetsp:Transcript_37335/g.91511  ORF Transcript_37335/g.91511 Transcript_37335/m.91511 type:complete len:296 (-) Transcript_37335:1084-1971(-)